MNSVVDYGFSIRPHYAEVVSGDAVWVSELDGGLLLAIVDGLGHGTAAYEAGKVALSYLETNTNTDVTHIMRAVHEQLRGTRGAAAGFAWLDLQTGRLQYAGTGNTMIRRFGDNETRLLSREGVLGERLPSPFPQEMVLSQDDVLVMYTDGIRSQFPAEAYPGLMLDTADMVSRTIVHRFGKEHDDAACLAVRLRP
ncbi:MAG: SpoIIE family protein phosphatase [Gemmataceae bacterium]